MSKAIQDVAAERERQMHTEGWSTQHDDEHAFFELSAAAAAYAQNTADFGHEFGSAFIADWNDAPKPEIWPWEEKYWKPKSPREDLVRAAALIIAEIERIDRTQQAD